MTQGDARSELNDNSLGQGIAEFTRNADAQGRSLALSQQGTEEGLAGMLALVKVHLHSFGCP